jgi:hypothetical protein
MLLIKKMWAESLDTSIQVNVENIENMLIFPIEAFSRQPT